MRGKEREKEVIFIIFIFIFIFIFPLLTPQSPSLIPFLLHDRAAPKTRRSEGRGKMVEEEDRMRKESWWLKVVVEEGCRK